MTKRQYKESGYEIFTFLNEAEFHAIEEFAKNWIYSLIETHHAGIRCRNLPLEFYHVWSQELRLAHSTIFCAKNRHQIPPQNISNLIQNQELKTVLQGIGLENYKLWDEGLGWLAFRFIRPGFGDGYPTSRKAWGPAKNVISAYVPIIGFAPEQTIALVEGSHLKDYPSILPTDSKFCRDEYRLDPNYEGVVYLRPALKPGQALIFHPNTLHSEDIESGTQTRLSLEFRLIAMGGNV